MGRVPIAQENRTHEGGERFPRIKMQEKGEKKRLTLVEVPWREYVHYLKTPIFDPDTGQSVKETRYKKDSTPYETDKLDFISQPICLGDEVTLQEKGMDPRNCPACEAAEKSKGDIPGPVQRFAVNVIDYVLRGGGWELKHPFSADVKIWAFPGRIYDDIEGYQREIGDLRNHDITLECEDPGWNRNKMGFRIEAGYAAAPKGYIRELLTAEGNKATDAQLKDACGRDTPRSRMQEDCDRVLRSYARLHNEGSMAQLPAHTGLQAGIDALLSEEEPASSAGTGSGLDEFALATTLNHPDRATRLDRQEAAEREAAAAGALQASSAYELATGQKAAQADPWDEDRPAMAAPATPAAGQDDFDFDKLMEGL
jgi:hypothetical protein